MCSLNRSACPAGYEAENRLIFYGVKAGRYSRLKFAEITVKSESCNISTVIEGTNTSHIFYRSMQPIYFPAHHPITILIIIIIIPNLAN